MIRSHKFKSILGIAAGLLILAGAANAGVPQDYTVPTTGTIMAIDFFKHTMLVDDATYGIADNVVVKNAKGRLLKLHSLYPGLRVRMLVRWSGAGKSMPMIQEITYSH
jgi:uncharacterized lipoprotein YajG